MIGLQTREEYAYEEQLVVRLTACSQAFEQVDEIEKHALENQALVYNKLWQRDYMLAMNRFRLECLALGRINEAPPGYEDGDIWIRQASSMGAHSAELHIKAIEKMDQRLMNEGVELFKTFQDCIRQSQTCFPFVLFESLSASIAETG